MLKKVLDRILNPLIEGFKRDGIDYKGILYAGLMIDEHGDPYVVEFNIRFGDPETQIVLPKLKTDLVDVLVAINQNELAQIALEWTRITVYALLWPPKGTLQVMKGALIQGINDSSDANSFVFHAGTKQTDSGEFFTNGGRVLNVCAEGVSPR